MKEEKLYFKLIPVATSYCHWCKLKGYEKRRHCILGTLSNTCSLMGDVRWNGLGVDGPTRHIVT